jgi:hypothetical protein
MRIRIQLIILMRIRNPDPAYHIDANPDQAYHIDTNTDPDSTFQFDADPYGSGSTTLVDSRFLK